MKRLLNNIWRGLKSIFEDSFDFVRKNSKIAVIVTDKLKLAVENKYAPFVVEIIPGEIDNIALDILKKYLPEVSYRIAVIHGLLQENDVKHEALDRIIEHLKTLNKDARVSFWVMFAGELNVALSDGKINLAEGLALSQLMYNELKNNRK
jgi:hypothetical protein